MNAERILLERLRSGPATGDALAGPGQTRASVWKRVQALRAAGVAIDAVPGRGYALAQPVDLLDADAITARLAPGTRARLASLEVAWSIDSSNSELLRRPARCDDRAEVLLAERQSAGRGRRGRAWTTPLAAQVALSAARGFAGGLARLGGLSLVAGVASVEALHALGATAVRLKWPNDLVVADGAVLRKLGGLLVEGAGEHAGPARAVVGLGLNVRMPATAMEGIDQPWTDLAHCMPVPPARDALAAALVDAWLHAFDAFERDGLAPVLARYARIDALAGRAVRVQAGEGVFEATACGLGDDGALQVRDAGGALRTVHSGEVSVRAA